MTASTDDFNPLVFEKKLTQLKDTQDSIQSLSTWCLQQRQHHKKIVASWLNVLKRAKVEQRLTLFYLANDVIQYSKRKNYEFVESWGTTLQKATPLVRDDKVKHRILRIFRIWEERAVYDEEFLTDLTGLLSAAAGKQTPDADPSEFQAIQLVNKIRQCSVLEADTDQQLKNIHESPLALKDTEALCTSLKERRDVDSARQELDEGIVRLEGYVRALQRELVARAALCHLLQRAHHHYTTQRGEVKVVANAYKNFGGRVRGLKRKLDELCDSLPAAEPVPPVRVSPVPSPPSPGEAVPSPGPDEDLDLPGQQDNGEEYNLDKTFSASILGDEIGKGFTSFMGHGDFPFNFQDDLDNTKEDSAGSKIEVISSRPNTASREDFNINDFLKSLIPNKSTAVLSSGEEYSGSVLTPPPPPPALLPGLDLLVPPPPPPPPPPPISLQSVVPNFYINASAANANDANTPEPVGVPAPEPYLTDNGSHWTTSWDDLQANRSLDTPESPPPVEQQQIELTPPLSYQEPPQTSAPDVDHRKLLAPPPPPSLPNLMLEGDDVDHRMLPPLPPPPSQTERNRPMSHKGDVDHRNLISLTGSLPPPPAPPVSPWNSHVTDQDYRNTRTETPVLVPPPTPPQMRRQSSSGSNMSHSPDDLQHSPPISMSSNLPKNIPQHSKNAPGVPVHPPNMSSLPPNMSSHPANISNISSLPPNMASHQPNMASHQPNMANQPTNMANQPPNIANQSPNMATHPPNMAMQPHNMAKHPPNIANQPPNMVNHPHNLSSLPPNMPSHYPSNNISHLPPSSMLQHPPDMLHQNHSSPMPPYHSNAPPNHLSAPPPHQMNMPLQHQSHAPQHQSHMPQHQSHVPQHQSHMPPNRSPMLPHMPNLMEHPPAIHHQNMSQLPPNMMNRIQPSIPDNVESIDMEMSDEEMLDDEYAHSRLEMALARLHGNPPNRHNQYRKSDHHHQGWDKSFHNNNKVLVGGNTSMHPPGDKQDVPIRSNLVRINSVPDAALDKPKEPPKVEEKEKKEEPQISIENNPSEEIISDEEDPFEDLEEINEILQDEASSQNDVFNDSRSNSMNPINPNASSDSMEPPEPAVKAHNEDNNWEESDEEFHQEEPQKWRNQTHAMNPTRPMGARPFHMRGAPYRMPFRHPHMFGRFPPPPPPNERFFNPEYQPRGGLRRPWGPRPHREYW